MKFMIATAALVFISLNAAAASQDFLLTCTYHVKSPATTGVLKSTIVIDTATFVASQIGSDQNLADHVAITGNASQSQVTATLGINSQTLNVFDLIRIRDEFDSAIQFQLEDSTGTMACVFNTAP